MRSKYTNPDCCAVIKCRLHCCYEEKSVGGILYWGYIKSPLCKFFTMSSSLKIFKEKKTRLLWSRDIFNQDCLIPSNRSITVSHGIFWFGFLWLGLFYAYWSISQKSVKGLVIQDVLIMGGNSKKWDELREKSTRAILVTQAVNALGYSILASQYSRWKKAMRKWYSTSM